VANPIIIDLSGPDGFVLRQKAADFVNNLKIQNIEAGSEAEQTYGILAEMAIRNRLGLPDPDPSKKEFGWDIELPLGVKADIKCRGGTLPFQEFYEGTGGIKREAKHNFFARQIHDVRLNTDIYIMVHLETPKLIKGEKALLPGTLRQKKWKLYICGWVSKERVKKEGVYLPRGAITEQGNKWFPYRGNEIEFYNQYLNSITKLEDLLQIDNNMVKIDEMKPASLHLTSVDAARIAIDLVGRGILNIEVNKNTPPILHPNQYHYFLNYLKGMGKATQEDIEKLEQLMHVVPYSGQ
jgi:hypothetical protein